MLSCAVIGCGPAGLAAAASLRQAGLMVTVFEMAPTAGGMWVTDATGTHSERGVLAPIPPSMRCVIPKDLMAFSDMPMYVTTPQFPHYSAVSDYLRRYAEQRGVNSITRFNTKVESVRFDAQHNVWKLISVGLVNSDAYEWAFDRVVVATGQCHAPRYPPEAEQLKAFSEIGTVTHSCFVKNPRDFTRKRVIVVGDGVSAYDLCQQLSIVGADVIHSTRMQPDADPSRPLLSFDALLNGDVLGSLRNRSNLTGVVSSLPFRRRGDHHANEVIASLMRHHESYKPPRRVGRIIRVEGDSSDILVRDDPTRRLTTSQLMNEVDTMGGASRSDLPTEELITDVDAVIFATGFHARYPFLPPEMRSVLETHPTRPLLADDASTREGGDGSSTSSQSSPPPISSSSRGLYRGCLWADNPTLGVIGALPDAFPPFMMMEAQSVFLSKVLTGKKPIPTNVKALCDDDDALGHRFPGLASFFPERGLGLNSSQYYNALMADSNVGSQGVPALKEPQSFSEAIFRRKWWFLRTWILQTINTVRGWAPLKRRQQHVLISNKI